MNNKGFSLVELLGCLALLAIIFCIGLYSAKGTLSTTLTTVSNVSENEIYDAVEAYILENKITWINTSEEYTCVTINDLVDLGYFDSEEVEEYKDKKIKVVRNSNTKVISNINLVDVCG